MLKFLLTNDKHTNYILNCQWSYLYLYQNSSNIKLNSSLLILYSRVIYVFVSLRFFVNCTKTGMKAVKERKMWKTQRQRLLRRLRVLQVIFLCAESGQCFYCNSVPLILRNIPGCRLPLASRKCIAVLINRVCRIVKPPACATGSESDNGSLYLLYCIRFKRHGMRENTVRIWLCDFITEK